MTRHRILRYGLLVIAFLALPAIGSAQEAVITGTITDSTGGILPGVTVTAVHEATGTTFVGVTDEAGIYRMPVRIGTFRITAELTGFSTVNRTGLTLLVGQTATIDVQMAPASVQESVTVTGEAPLINVRSSTVGANLDSKQLSEIPLSGRNWVDLVMLAPGSRANEVGTNGTGGPVARTGRSGGVQGTYQLNIDGQQVTGTVAGTFTNPNFSRESIAEFQFIANRFDAAQGRSAGIQVNAVTKSGTNTASGSLSGYFRNSRWGGRDFIRHTILPYSDQQLVGTFGGPIRKDKIHIFGHYEYEREPRTVAFTTPWPAFNLDLSGDRREDKSGARLDWDLGGQRRLTVSTSFWRQLLPNRFDLNSSTDHPSTATHELAKMMRVSGQVTQVISNRAVNVVTAGVYRQTNNETSFIGDDKVGKIQLNNGLSIGPGLTDVGRTPFHYNPTTYSIRDEFTFSFNTKGRHDLKTGGEYLYNTITDLYWCNYCRGWLDARGGPVPANVQQLFPVWNDPSTWNVNALSPISVRYRKAFGSPQMSETKHMPGIWFQDDWAVTSKLVLNLGVRYDLEVGAYAENLGLEIKPFVPPNRHADKNNIAPRVGFAYSMTDTTVIRGGGGRFYAQMFARDSFYTHALMQTVIPEIRYDGRADFASNPFNGAEPTYEQVVARTCPAVNNAPGCYRLDLTRINSTSMDIPYSWQSSIGVQQQLGNEIGVTADFVYNGLRNTEVIRNINLTYNPATGVNYPFSDLARRAFPDWGLVNVVRSSTDGYANDYALQTGITKRFTNGWQLAGTYTLGMLKDADPSPVNATIDPQTGYVQYTKVPFATAPDLGGEYGYAVTDQRHRATLNGVWELPFDFQVSGLYFYGSGMRFAAAYSGDTRSTGAGGTNRFNPTTGIIAPRNNFVGKPLHRVDVRFLRRFSFGGRVAVDGILEVFNLLNHVNYGNYVTTLGAANFGAPVAQDNVAYKPRQLQLGFRATF